MTALANPDTRKLIVLSGWIIGITFSCFWHWALACRGTPEASG